MFKKDREIWTYLILTALMFLAILFLTQNFLLPFFSRRQVINFTLNSTSKRPVFNINTSLNYLANISTNYGSITLKLYPDSAPNNVNNFIYLVRSNYYIGTKFHRVVKDFLIQGGDKNTIKGESINYGEGNPGYFIDDEINWDSLNLNDIKKNKLKSLGFKSNTNLISHPLEQYSLAMANSGPNTNGSQFFIVTANSNDSRLIELNGNYTVIGKVIDGFDTLDKINIVNTNKSNNQVPIPIANIFIIDNSISSY